MRNEHWARLGQLMLQGGHWNGEQILSADYVRQALARIPQNEAYGLLFWLNGGNTWQVPDLEGLDAGMGNAFPAVPDDMYAMVGLGEQRTYIIPSRGLIIVRLGERGSHDPDSRVLLWSGRAGEIDWELPRRVLLAITDVPYADPGPYQSAGAHVPPVSEGIYGDALDIVEHAEAMSVPACH
jgi:CubicO group peptidase (beta-lactamase class C family)